MTVEIKTSLGKIDIAEEVIAKVAGGAALDCYGLVGMASQKSLKDGIVELLRKENLSRGVVVRKAEDGVNIDVYIIVSYGTKISEVAHNVQEKIRYTLQQSLGIEMAKVNVFVQGVRVANP
ncbi:Asp23/Gls24 family envelope stress response protein [Bacillaceae bacterium]